VLRAEWQATWAPDKVNIVTFGVEGNVDRVEADLFGKRSGGGYAFYAQDEIQLLEGLKGTIGARYDFQDVDSLESSSRVNPKIGLVYSLAGGTALRGSYGGGFRVPSIAEAFITTQAGGLDIVPNPRLKPERSYSLEMGLSQPVGEVALFDLAIFHSSFSDLIEPGFVVIDSLLKGRFNNVVKARVQGIETSLKLGLFDRSVFLDAGYTYVYPKDLTRHDILKYRPRHLLYAGGLARIGWCSIGADFRYLSRVERIDEEFSLFITDAGERVSISIADVRLGADFTQLGFPLSVLLNVNNLLQYNYVELIGNLAPPRTVVLTIETSL
jgi:iron complex outermembrane receptor protein